MSGDKNIISFPVWALKRKVSQLFRSFPAIRKGSFSVFRPKYIFSILHDATKELTRNQGISLLSDRNWRIILSNNTKKKMFIFISTS